MLEDKVKMGMASSRNSRAEVTETLGSTSQEGEGLSCWWNQLKQGLHGDGVALRLGCLVAQELTVGHHLSCSGPSVSPGFLPICSPWTVSIQSSGCPYSQRMAQSLFMANVYPWVPHEFI